jgi:iron uptake system component EfeO
MLASRRRAMVPALVALLMVTSTPTIAQETENRVRVNLSEAGCDPAAISVPAGPVVLELTNQGGDVAEFEILRGDFVVDEAENIVPGFQDDLVTRLDGGEYTTVCYSLQSPRGTLSVAGGPAATTAHSSVVDAATLPGYQTAYETYVRAQATELVTRVTAFTAALKAGDLDTARALYASSRVPWETIEPIAELFTDLDHAIDSREEDVQGVDDPAWTGFHRIERILWVDHASGNLDALADGLLANTTDLASRLATLPLDAYTMAQGAGALIEEVAQTKMTGEEDRYSGTDLWAIAANIEGSHRIVDILRPSLESVAPNYLAQLDAAFVGVDTLIDRYRDGDGFRRFGDVTPADITALQAALAGLAEVLSRLSGTLGLTA